ncbi:transcriptional regulator [Corynebacterium aquilae DSM 44791]|uniref:Transcriptional regulator n=1 Tax=Corynebacterium aquilae DSM 44791 TaxID=1431546 RepID=A0A1L7CH81_9CORY|nr:Rv2175c family DNA-binding protein [Corynebacterium aquilae]APT85103.1 transcriptional regulator [Corynebacterium aquilae DSM 44791]
MLPDGEPVITVPDAAERMGVVVTCLQNLLKQHELIAVTKDGVAQLPEKYFHADGTINKFVPGVIKLLSDGSYTDEEILQFLFTEDDSLPGRPVDALHGHLAREVMRRAQAMAL